MKMKMLFTTLLSLFFAATLYAADVVPLVIDQPGTQPQEVSNLESPDKCDNCHGGYNTAVEPAHNWRGSMMANAGRDPIFWATLAIAEQDFDGAGDLCIRCHSTAGWLAGRSTPTDGSGLAAGDSDGVECDFCHKMTNPNNTEHLGEMFDPFIANDPITGEGYYGSGISSIWGSADKLGPYATTNARHQFMQSKFHRSVDFCGTCHDVSNPAVGNLAHNFGAQPTGGGVIADGALDGTVDTKAAFNNPPYAYGIVERTFSEYKSGLVPQTLVDDYPNLPADLQGGALEAIYNAATKFGTKSANYADGDPRYYSCQSCHLRPVTGQGCNKNPEIRDDLPLHDMTGGNYWMPSAIQWLDNQSKLRLGGGLTQVQVNALDDGALRAREQLELAATLSVTGDTLKVVNHTGHKLISGYPEGRRMWLNIVWYDSNGAVVREDGAYGPMDVTVNGQQLTVDTILDLHPATGEGKIYEAHYGLTQEWAAQLLSLGYDPATPLSYDRVTGAVDFTLGELGAAPAGTEQETFHFVLNNTVVKDNRIPPYGMSYDEASIRNALPVPADQYGNPGPGEAYNYFDEVTLLPPAGAASATLDLLYQPTSFEYQQFLLLANKRANTFLADEGVNMFDAWLATGMAQPHIMASTTWGTPPATCDAQAPTLFTTTPGNSQVTLEWTDEASGDPNVAGYKVYYDQAGKAQLVADVGLATSYVDTGLTNGQQYCYKVTSYYDAGCESPFSNINCATPNNQGQTSLNVSKVETGKSVTTGKGKNQTTTFTLTSSFNLGDEVVVRAYAVDTSTGQPVSGTTMTIEISGPETLTFTVGPSGTDGMVEALWKTQTPNRKGNGGTTPGSYTAAVIQASSAGYTWDGVNTQTSFTLQ